MNDMSHSPMSLDPPEWSPLTEPSLDDANSAGGGPLDQRQAEDWIDWMKWDEKEENGGAEDSLTPRLQPQMLTPDTQESEKMSVRSSSSEASSIKLTLNSAPVNQSSASLTTPTSTSTALSNLSPNSSDDRSSLESIPGSTMLSGIPSTLPVFAASHGPKPSRKRKSTAEDTNTGTRTPVESRISQAAKRPHNMVERRYRNNLNEKIAALRDSVPSLRVKKSVSHSADHAEDDSSKEGADSSPKLNKGSILSKATEYISHLELRARRLDEENLALKTRLRRLERLLEQRDMATPSIRPTSSGGRQKSGDDVSSSKLIDSANPTPSSPKGLIPVPESMRRLRMNASQEHYADRYLQDQNLDGEDPKEGKPRGKFMTRMMIGSLAGLMVMDSFVTKKENGERSNIQGLLAIPVDLISTFAAWLRLSEASNLFPLGHLHAGLLPVVRFFLALNILAFLVFIYLFSSKPMGSSKSHNPFGAALSLSSPIQIRRQAWLTSIQTVWVPRHTLFTEFIATTLEALKYFVRYLVGWPIYSWLTGRTEDYEIARRKALDILIDAQLAGGDPEISRSRLVLTIFASGTLPNTTVRLMVKALHARIILWRVGRSGSLTCRLADATARRIARYQWAIAQRLAKSDAMGVDLYDGSDQLPPYLTALLRYSSDEALNDSIVHRAYNLAWVRPMSGGIETEDSMNAVGEDAAVRSPLDAVAAWWSTSLLNRALLETLATRVDNSKLIKLFDIAQCTAPTSSVAQIRAHAARAIFIKKERISSINHLLDALPPYKTSSIQLQSSPYVPSTNFFASELPSTARNEIRHAASCAIVIALLENGLYSSSRYDFSNLLQKSFLHHQKMTLLGFISVRQLLRTIHGTKVSVPVWETQFQQNLRIWASNEAKKSSGRRQEIFWRASRGVLDEEGEVKAGTKTGRIRRWSNDTGYESQTE